jgi:REP element-mobilizing transposase RayT
MVLGYHLIWGAYGFWLPNDPRGSWSTFVASWELFHYGRATKTDDHRSVAAAPHDRRLRLAAKRSLKYPAVQFTGRQALSVSRGFRRAIAESDYSVLACAILRDHVHPVVGRHRQLVGRMIGHFKGRAMLQLIADGLWSDAARPVWSERGWKVFLDSVVNVRRAIRYVEQNPMKARLPRQRWSFVVPFEMQQAPGEVRQPSETRTAPR